MARRSVRKSRKTLRLIALAVLVLLILTVRLYEDIGFDQDLSSRFVVASIIDGDTIELLGGDKLRLLSIDTPEEGEPYYDEAAAFLSQMALGKQARIEFADHRRDKYGRLLGYLYIDSVFVNEALIDNGLANLYLFREADVDRPETRQMLIAQRRAITERRGIWSVERQAEDYYIVKDNSFRIHRPGCRSVADLKEGHYRRLKTREEGLVEGLSPCRNCQP